MTRKIFGLAVVLIAAAFPSAAMAEFESTTGKSQGNIKAFPERVIWTMTKGGPALECKAKNSEGKVIAEGGWQIQVKSTTQQGKLFYQAPTTKGPHEQLKIIKWGLCTAPLALPVAVSCNLQIETTGMSETASMSVYPPGCTFNINSGSCIIIIQPDGNKELQGAIVTNVVAGGIEISGGVSGFTSTTQENGAGCKNLGIQGSQGGGSLTFVTAFITEGQKLTN